MYRITHTAYCGMTIPRGEYETKADAHTKMRRIAKFYAERYGCPITWRGPQNIEIEEPENCIMVPDFCGTTMMRKIA